MGQVAANDPFYDEAAVVSVITLPQGGSVEDVVEARLRVSALPTVVRLALQAHSKSTPSETEDGAVNITVPLDLSNMWDGLYSLVLSEVEALDEITVDPNTQSTYADEAIESLPFIWQAFFWKNSFVDAQIQGPSDPPSVFLKIQSPSVA